MVGVPWFWWVKIGITHVSIGAAKRAFAIDKAMWGFPFPIMVVPIPGAYHFEQKIHRELSFLSCRFYKGDGSSEWFWCPAALFVLPIMFATWGIYIAIADYFLGTTVLPFLAKRFFGLFF